MTINTYKSAIDAIVGKKRLEKVHIDRLHDHFAPDIVGALIIAVMREATAAELYQIAGVTPAAPVAPPAAAAPVAPAPVAPPAAAAPAARVDSEARLTAALAPYATALQWQYSKGSGLPYAVMPLTADISVVWYSKPSGVVAGSIAVSGCKKYLTLAQLVRVVESGQPAVDYLRQIGAID